MHDNDLVAGFAAWFAEKLLIEVDSADTDLIATGVLDSAGVVELLLHIEEQFGFSLPADALELESFHSLRSIAQKVAACRAAADSKPSPDAEMREKSAVPVL